MKLSYKGLQDKQAWKNAGIELPKYDWEKMCALTAKNPIWIHFGAGNIFRGFIAGLQQNLLNEGLADRGIIAAETFDYEIIDKIYENNAIKEDIMIHNYSWANNEDHIFESLAYKCFCTCILHAALLGCKKKFCIFG